MSIRDEMLSEFREELVATQRILDRIPADKLAWKPHEKSMSLGQLAMHIATVPAGIVFITSGDSFDVSKGNFTPPSPKDKAEMHLKVAVDDCCLQQPRAVAHKDSVGKEYLSNLRETAARQRERQTKGRAIAVQMQRLFVPQDEEVTCRTMDNGKMLLDISHLIDAKCVERYQNKFASTRELLKDCQMQLSGPWPPYHFVHRLTRPHTVAPGIPA